LAEVDVARLDLPLVFRVERRVMRAVAVEDEVLDDEVAEVFAGEERKQRGDLRLVQPPEVFPQALKPTLNMTDERHADPRT